ncbi:18695_t:CDS:2, partial [Gigaspora rosea]
NKRIQLNTQKLETIAKLCTYYNSNAKKELSYFANNMDEKQLLEILNQTNIENFKEVLEREDVDEDELLLFDNLELNESSFSIKTKDDLVLFLENSNYDWDPEDLVNSDDD